MASKKRCASSSRPQEPYDMSRFVFETAWERFKMNVHHRNILPERNMELAYSHYDEFLRELERCQWHRNLTRLMENHINLALVKEFYSNLYDPEDRSPIQCKVRGKTIKFDASMLNTFLETSVVLEPRERYSAYSRFCHTYPDPQAIAAKLCLLGRRFILNVEGALWKLLRNDLTTLAQTWSVLSYCNLAPTSHTSDLNMDRARLV